MLSLAQIKQRPNLVVGCSWGWARLLDGNQTHEQLSRVVQLQVNQTRHLVLFWAWLAGHAM
jgi:hypothetical protein